MPGPFSNENYVPTATVCIISVDVVLRICNGAKMTNSDCNFRCARSNLLKPASAESECSSNIILLSLNRNAARN